MEEERKYTTYELKITIDEEGNIIKASKVDDKPLDYEGELRLDDGKSKIVYDPKPTTYRCRWRHRPTCQMICV